MSQRWETSYLSRPGFPRLSASVRLLERSESPSRRDHDLAPHLPEGPLASTQRPNRLGNSVPGPERSAASDGRRPWARSCRLGSPEKPSFQGQNPPVGTCRWFRRPAGPAAKRPVSEMGAAGMVGRKVGDTGKAGCGAINPKGYSALRQEKAYREFA